MDSRDQKPVDVDLAEVWNAREAEFQNWEQHIDSIEETGSKRAAFNDLLKRLEELLSDPQIDYACHVFTFTAERLAAGWECAWIWQWWRHIASALESTPQKTAFVIACLEPIPLDPVNWDDVHKLLELLGDERTMWATFAAYQYDSFPELLLQHYARYRADCFDRGTQPIEFPRTALELEIRELDKWKRSLGCENAKPAEE